jgi:hypothetical protein
MADLMHPSSGRLILRGRRSFIPNSAKAGRVLSRPPLNNLQTPVLLDNLHDNTAVEQNVIAIQSA